MKKAKKVLALLLAFVMTVVCTVGATLAYLQDKDAEKNTFTVGNVKIDLIEEFDEENAKLLPSTGSAQDDTLQNGIKKVVSVENLGSEDAYVRVHIAIPQVLDDGDPDFNAGKNVLHFNYEPESVGEGKWDWSKSTGAPYEGDFNFYTTEINGVWYNVYVVTYESVLDDDENSMAARAMHQVYLDSKVTNEDLYGLDDKLGGTNPDEFDGDWSIYVVAEGVQAEGFQDAYAALNEAFGTPGSYTIDWNAAPKGN